MAVSSKEPSRTGITTNTGLARNNTPSKASAPLAGGGSGSEKHHTNHAHRGKSSTVEAPKGATTSP